MPGFGETLRSLRQLLEFSAVRARHFSESRLRESDFSISKIWKFNERIKMQFRGEFFNILNHPNFDAFSLNNDLSVPAAVGTAIFTPDLGSASNPVLGAGGSGHVQSGAKVIW